MKNANTVQNSNANIIHAQSNKTDKIENKSIANASTNTTAVNNNSTVVEKKENISQSIPPIFATQPQMPILETKYGIGGNRDALHTEAMFEGSRTGFGLFSLRLTGIMTSKLLQGNNMTLPLSKNLGLAVKMDLDRTTSVRAEAGIEGGIETFPLYLSNGKGGFTSISSISWLGASFTFSAPATELFNFYPEARILGAASNGGPIVKGSLGLVFPINPMLSFSMDGEETMLFIQSNGAYLTGNKLAVTAALTLHF